MEAQMRPGGGVHVRTAAAVAHLTIEEPAERSGSVQQSIHAAGRSMAGDVRVVVLWGRWTFADPADDDDAGSPDVGPLEWLSWLQRSDVVAVAALSGLVSGGGLALALACDVRIAADDATFAVAASGQGQLPPAGVAPELVAAVGYARAFQLCVLGLQLPAQQAYQEGLLSGVVSSTELEATTDRVVAELLRLPRSPTIETKALLRAAAAGASPAAGAVKPGSAERAAQRRLARERAGYADG